MDQSGKLKSTCLICLKTFDSPAKIEEDGESVFKAFLQLLTNYLEVKADSDFQFTTHDNWSDHQLFCESCSVQVNRVNENYLELLSIEQKLSTKLEELGELMKQSEGAVSSKLSCVLLKSLATQLGFENSSHVRKLRKFIVSKCMTKRNKCPPKDLFRPASEEVDDDDQVSNLFSEVEVKEEVETHSEDEQHPHIEVDTDFLHETPNQNQSPVSERWQSGADAEDRDGKEEWEPTPEEGEDNMNVSSESSATESDNYESDSSSSSHSSGRTIAKPNLKARESSKKVRNRKQVIKRRGSGRRKSHEAKYHCEACGNPFDTLHNLQIHAKASHKDIKNSIKCCFCFRSFALHQVYQLHIQTRHKNMDTSFPCDDPQCSQVFSSHTLLNEHLKSSHSPSKIHYCAQCSWGFLDPYLLTIHEFNHESRKNNVFHCRLCSSHFSNLDRLQDHHNVKHGSRQKIRKCPKCPVRCATMFSINLHMKSHLEKEDPEHPLSCPDCGKTCKDVGTLKFHRTWYHTEIHCPHSGCEMKFRRRLHLVRHIKLEHNLGSEGAGSSSGVLIPCEVCGKPIKITEFDDSLMKTHLETHLSVEERQRVICDLCGDPFSSEMALLEHVAKVHQQRKKRRVNRQSKPNVEGKRKKFICEICAKVCHYHKSLLHHMDTVHHNPTPEVHKCKFLSCIQSFQTQEQLQSHVQQEHEGEFICNLCGRLFQNLQRLQRHAVLHTGEKAHECSICKKRFSLSWTLKVHLKNIHGNSELMEEYQCQQTGCEAKFKLKAYLMRHLRRKHKIFVRTGN